MRRYLSLAVVVLLGVAGYFWWTHGPSEILPAPPNHFVKTVAISRIVPKVEPGRDDRYRDATPVPISSDPEANRSYDGTIETPATAGQYLLIDLERFETPPEIVDGENVNSPDQWPISFAVYRLGDPDGESACEFICHLPDGAIAPPAMHSVRGPPPMLPVIGTSIASNDFVGFPAIAPAESGHNVFWTFIVPPDKEDPAGEYVYEVRLYPTARWVSAVRWETGEPIVLRRGLLIASDLEIHADAEAAEEGG